MQPETRNPHRRQRRGLLRRTSIESTAHDFLAKAARNFFCPVLDQKSGVVVSSEALKWAWELEGLTMAQKSVLLALAGFHHHKTGDCFPSKESIAERSGASRDTVTRTIPQLIQGGWISVEGSRGRKSNRYVLHMRKAQSSPVKPDDSQPVQDTQPADSQPVEPADSDSQPADGACQPADGAFSTGRQSAAIVQRKNKEPTRERTRTRATPPPDRFPVTEDLRAWAAEHAPGVDLYNETQKFIDHHKARGSLFKDWTAAWRNWIRKAVGYQKQDSWRGNGQASGSVNGNRRKKTAQQIALESAPRTDRDWEDWRADQCRVGNYIPSQRPDESEREYFLRVRREWQRINLTNGKDYRWINGE